MGEQQAQAHDFFEDTWSVYHKIVRHNYMSHSELFEAAGKIIQERAHTSFSFLDLGCGDATSIVPILKRLNPSSYIGVDLSDTALDAATKQCSDLSCPSELKLKDLLSFLEDSNDRFDVIFSSFAIHHLDQKQKKDFMLAAQKRLTDGGLIVIIDVVMDEGQSKEDYLDSYCRDINSWPALSLEEKKYVESHVRNYDRPNTLKTIKEFASEANLHSFEPICHFGAHHLVAIQTQANS